MKCKELPLPAGVKPVPETHRFVGRPLPEVTNETPPGWMAIDAGCSLDSWELKAEGVLGWMYLQNRLFAAPIADVIPLVKPAPVEPVKGRFVISRGGLLVGKFSTAENAYDSADKMARANPMQEIYVYELRAKFTGTVTVNRTDY